MSNISFANPWYLLIAAPLIVLFAVPYALAVRKENINGHSVASLVLHVLLSLVIAFAAAGTTIRTVLTETDIWVVADVSYSSNAKLDLVDEYISGLEMPDNSKLGIVTFGKDFEVLTEMGESVKSVRDSTVDASETDIAGALEFAGSLFKDDVIKRVVLITDGKSTDSRDAYAVTRAVDGLEAKDISVDAIYIDANLTSDLNEIQITDVEYTRSTFTDHPETAVVTVQSTFATDATLTLTRGGERVRRRVIELSEGRNNFSFELDTSVAGVYDYKFTVEAAGDRNPRNNEFLFAQNVTSDLRVLYVTGSWEDAKNAIERYATGTVIDIYERDMSVRNDLMDAYVRRLPEGSRVTVYHDNGGAMRVPTTIERLTAYDEIVISDIRLEDINAYGTFVDSVDTVVSQFGKSLITIGDLAIRPEDEKQLAFEDMLPVRYNKSPDGPKLYTLIIDSSRSMNRLFHLSVAKELAVRLLDFLGEEDEVCVVNFYGNAEVVQSPTPVNENTRASIVSKINNIKAKNGTVIEGGLKMAYDLIRDLPQSDKQVMLISDGKNYSTSAEAVGDSVTVVSDMYAAGIVSSVFDVGRQGDDEKGNNDDPVAQAAADLLRAIAETGGGNYYYSHNLEDVSDVTFDKITADLNGLVITDESPVRVANLKDDVLSGIDVTQIPSVSTFVYSTPKPSAVTSLTVEYKSQGSGVRNVPFYSHWEYGKGKVFTLASKEGDGWMKNWTDKEGLCSAFFGNVLSASVPEEKINVPYTFSAEWTDTVCRLIISPPARRYDAFATVKITTPNGDEYIKEMNSSGITFFYDFEADGLGSYTAEFTYSTDGVDYITREVFSLSVMPEYDSFAVFDRSELERALNGRGAVSLDGNLDLSVDYSLVASYTVDLTVPLLISAVVLFVVDIIVRKLRWEDIVSLFGFAAKKKQGGKKE